MLEVGIKAPDFTLLDKDGKEVSLSDFIGKKVIIYFYPKDNTPGCTAQACSYRDNIKKFEDKNTIIIGISKDSQKSHQKFSDKYDLPFILLSDEDLVAIKLYDVWQEKKLYGKTYMGVVRSTFLVDEDGKLVYVNYKVKAKDDAERMLGEII